MKSIVIGIILIIWMLITLILGVSVLGWAVLVEDGWFEIRDQLIDKL